MTDSEIAAAVLTASEQPEGSVAVTVDPTTEPVTGAHGPKNPDTKVTVGDVMVNVEGKVAVTVSPAASAPAPDVLKPTVQVSVTPALLVNPLKVTDDT